MKVSLVTFIAFTFFVSCGRQEEESAGLNESAKVTNPERTMIRSINVNTGKERIGIELNGERARLIINPYSKEREYLTIPYCEGLALLEQFYSIKNVKNHLGESSDRLYEASQYIVNIYDDMPGRYSDDWIYYVYPKNESMSDGDFRGWLAAMQSAETN